MLGFIAAKMAEYSIAIMCRVLGVSRTEIAPATAVNVFTGNGVSPKGDLARIGVQPSYETTCPPRSSHAAGSKRLSRGA